jgi:hypothetical protein
MIIVSRCERIAPTPFGGSLTACVIAPRKKTVMSEGGTPRRGR